MQRQLACVWPVITENCSIPTAPSHKASPECEGENENNIELGQAAGPTSQWGLELGIISKFPIESRATAFSHWALLPGCEAWS